MAFRGYYRQINTVNIKQDSKCMVPSMYNVKFFFSQIYYFPYLH